jgi:hypothetical protein
LSFQDVGEFVSLIERLKNHDWQLLHGKSPATGA